MWVVIKINFAFGLYFLCIQRKRFQVNKASPSRQEVKVKDFKVVVPRLEQLAANQEVIRRSQGRKTHSIVTEHNSATLDNKFKLKTG